MRRVEDICIFYKKQPTYNPQGLIKVENPKIKRRKQPKDDVYGDTLYKTYTTTYTNYPKNLLEFKNIPRNHRLHPTQKPVALLEYLIKTYTNENDTVLDNCMGSGSTGEACINTNRKFIGFELDEQYFNVARERVKL